MLKQAAQNAKPSTNHTSTDTSYTVTDTSYTVTDDDIQVIELDATNTTNSTNSTNTTNTTSTHQHPTKLRPNDKVSVKYANGRVDFDTKWKKVKDDVEAGRAELV
jgi:hypothetical protein